MKASINKNGEYYTIKHSGMIFNPTEDDYKIIERVPLTKEDSFDTLNSNEGDEKTLVILDTETTGLCSKTNKIIELGMVKLTYSPSTNKLSEVIDEYSCFEDPKEKLTDFISNFTGITDADLAGKEINDDEVARFLKDVDFVVAHNAGFDRKFFDKRFPKLANLKWACSKEGIDWDGLGIKSSKLEFLVYSNGYFYDAHRAITDCEALAWLLFIREDAFKQLLESVSNDSYIVYAIGALFENKDALKDRGYRWDGKKKLWWTCIRKDKIKEEKQFLTQTYRFGGRLSRFVLESAENRFK